MTRELGDELLPCPCHLCGAPVVKDRWGFWSHDDTHDEACFLAGFQLEDADDLHRWNDVREIGPEAADALASARAEIAGLREAVGEAVEIARELAGIRYENGKSYPMADRARAFLANQETPDGR
jgi:hypothetical protein